MKWLQSKNRPVDERIVNMRNKIYKEAYVFVVLICCLSVIVKYILYGPNIGAVATELIVLLLPSLYYGIRSAFLGLYSDEVEMHDRTSKLPFSLKNVLIGLGFGVALALFIGIRSAITYGDGGAQSWWYFTIVFAASLMIYIPLFVGIMAFGHALANKASKAAAAEELDE